MEAKSEPCPFCGGEGQLQGMTPENGGDRRHFVHCRSCGADGPWFKVAASAVKGWNRRTPGPATAKMLAWLKNEIILTPYDFDELSVAFRAEHEGQGVLR